MKRRTKKDFLKIIKDAVELAPAEPVRLDIKKSEAPALDAAWRSLCRPDGQKIEPWRIAYFNGQYIPRLKYDNLERVVIYSPEYGDPKDHSDHETSVMTTAELMSAVRTFGTDSIAYMPFVEQVHNRDTAHRAKPGGRPKKLVGGKPLEYYRKRYVELCREHQSNPTAAKALKQELISKYGDSWNWQHIYREL